MRRCLVVCCAALASSSAHAAAPLAFDDALASIVARTTAVGIQARALDQTKARNLPIRTAILPTISAVGTQTRYTYGGVTDPNYNTAGTKSAQLQANLNVFHFGADWVNWQAATDDETAQSAQLEASTLKAEDAGVQLLVNDIQRRLEVAALQKLVDSRKHLAEIGKQRFDRGLLPLQESQKLEIDLDNAQSRLTDAVIQQDAARASLAEALGAPGADEIPSDWPWTARFLAARPLSQSKLDLEQLPTWRSARAQAAAEANRESRDLRLILPTLDASGAYGYTNTYDNIGPSQLGWTGTLTLTVPLFDHLSTYSTYRAQVAVRQTAELTLEQAERDARSELVSAQSAFRNAYASSLARRRTAELARRLYSDNLRRFQAGRANTDELAIDEQRLYEAELLDVDGWASTHVAFARLCHALGRKVAGCTAGAP